MTKQQHRIIEVQITTDICKKYPDIFLSTQQAAEALGTSRNSLGDNNDFGLKPIKSRGRSFKYLRPQVIQAVIKQVSESL